MISGGGPHANTAMTPPPEPLAPGAGLEVTSFISNVSERTLAAALAPYIDQPPPIPHEMLDLWSAHGIRMVAVPITDSGSLIKKLQTTGNTQRQWLGQAFAWTEAARASEGSSGEEIIALDAERIRLAPGLLRLLVRSWIEPAPPEPAVGAVTTLAQHAVAPSAPAAALWIELLPQHEEASREDSLHPFANLESRLDSESQGLNFSRLYARLNLPSDRVLLILPEHPGVNWKELASGLEPASVPVPKDPAGKPDAGPSHKSRVGDVSHGPLPTPAPSSSGAEIDQPPESAPGPAAARIPTLGEAMLTQRRQPFEPRPLDAPQRTIILLIPRVPSEFQLLSPGAPAAPPSSSSAPGKKTPSSPTPARP